MAGRWPSMPARPCWRSAGARSWCSRTRSMRSTRASPSAPRSPSRCVNTSVPASRARGADPYRACAGSISPDVETYAEQVPAPALGRPAAAGRAGARAGARARVPRRRRAGLDARRLGARRHPERDEGDAASRWGSPPLYISHDLALVRYVCAAHADHVSRRGGRGRPDRGGRATGRSIPTPRRWSRRCRCPMSTSRASRCRSRAACPMPAIRRPAAGSATAALMPSSAAPTRSRPLRAIGAAPPRRLPSARLSAGLPERVAAVDDQGRAGHVARGVARQVDRQRPEILRLAEIAIGMCSLDPSITSGCSRAQRWLGSVMKPPGQIALTVTPCGAQSAAAARVNWTIAAFAVS